MDANAKIAELEAKIKDYETNGVPGVMHSVDNAFYKLAIAERNHAWTESATRLLRIEALRRALQELVDRRREVAARQGHLTGQSFEGSDGRYARAQKALDDTK